MASQDFDLEFLSHVETEPQEAEESVIVVEPVEIEAHQPTEELLDLAFLTSSDRARAKSAKPAPTAPVTDDSGVTEAMQLVEELGALQPVDFEPMEKAQKWSLETADDSIHEIDRHWQDSDAAASPKESHQGSVETEELPRFDPVPENIHSPLMLEGEDSLFGEDEDTEASGQTWQLEGAEHPDLDLVQGQPPDTISLDEDPVESPFVGEDEALVLPQEPAAMEEYQTLLAEHDTGETKEEFQTFDLDLSALPGLDDSFADPSEETATDPIVADEPMIGAFPDLSEEPLILGSSAQARIETTATDVPQEASTPANDRTETGAKRVTESSFSLASLFANAQLVGLDIGSAAVKYAVVKKAARGFKLVNCGMRALPGATVEGNNDERSGKISEVLLREFKIKSYKNALISSAVSGLEVVYKNVQVPKMTPKELSKAVPWACRKDFPFPIESTVFEYDVIQKRNVKSDAKLDIFVAAAQKESVLNHVNLLRKAQILPDKVSTVASALWNLFQLLDKKYQEGCYAMVDIGCKASHIVFINDGQLQFAREIPTGGDAITEGLTGSIFVDGEEISISREKAEGLKRRYGYLSKINIESQEEVLPLTELAVMMGPVLEKLAKEIQRTVDFFKERFAVEGLEKVFITGGTSLLKNLPAYLSKELATEVDILNPFEHISVKKFSNQQDLLALGPRMAVPLGLAIDKRKQLNLLPAEIRGARTSQNVKKLFHYMSVIMILAMVFLSQNVKRQIGNIENEFDRRTSEYEIDRPKREKFLTLQKQIAGLKKLENNYHKGLDFELNKAEHMRAISNLIPRNISLTSLAVTFRELQDEDNEPSIDEILILTGVAFNKDSMEGINLAQFLLALEKSNYFYDIELKTQKIREDGNLEFLVECII